MSAYLAKVVEIIINPIIHLMFSVSFIIFAWGIFIFIANADDVAKRKTGKDSIMWGIIGMVIMIGAGAIFVVLENTIFQVA